MEKNSTIKLYQFSSSALIFASFLNLLLRFLNVYVTNIYAYIL